VRAAPSSADATTAARLVYVGHATLLLDLDGVRLLTDPVLRRWVLHLRRVAAIDLAALQDVDAVLVSHVHYDHLDLRSLRLLPRGATVVAPRGSKRLLRRFRDVREVDVGDETSIGDVRIEATLALHSSARVTLRATRALGFVVHGSRSVYFAGDTDVFEEMAGLAGSLDVALLPVAGWGPRVPAGHLNPERAVEALRLLRPRIAVPIHWGTYARLGLHASAEPAERFRRLAAEQAPEVDVRILAPGTGTAF
jgi:L-ascorbate metabolism protein UlaG (beta-lactamase superfamily)